MRILALMDHYLPGYRAGGPVRTLSNAIASLPAAYRFSVLTRDRDLGQDAPYPDVVADAWNDRDGTEVHYLSRRGETVRGVGRVVRRLAPDVVYLNSLLSRMVIRYLLARRLGLAPRTPLVLAPRGELAPGALALNPARKRLYLALGARLGLFRGVLWQASSPRERDEITAALRSVHPALLGRGVLMAPELVARRPLAAGARPKQAGRARLVFVSRVSPMKNLHFGIARLAGLRGEVSLDVYGPEDDPDYARRCREAAAALPAGVRVAFHGPVAPGDVAGHFAAHDAFLLPTLGENFGHVIFEALAAGCPVVLSDTTSWGELGPRRAGWTLPLGDPAAWQAALQALVELDEAGLSAMRAAAVEVAGEHAGREDALRLNARVFDAAVEGWDAARPREVAP